MSESLQFRILGWLWLALALLDKAYLDDGDYAVLILGAVICMATAAVLRALKK